MNKYINCLWLSRQQSEGSICVRPLITILRNANQVWRIIFLEILREILLKIGFWAKNYIRILGKFLPVFWENSSQDWREILLRILEESLSGLKINPSQDYYERTSPSQDSEKTIFWENFFKKVLREEGSLFLGILLMILGESHFPGKSFSKFREISFRGSGGTLYLEESF